MSQTPDNPAPLVVAASLAAIQGGGLFVFAVLELAHVSGERVTMGVTTAVFFAVYGAALLACAWAVTHDQAWARSPLLLTQLIQLGLAWSFRGGGTTWVAVGLAVVAVVVLLGLLHPASIQALNDDPTGDS
ncbi:hypothetical protein [Nocardioides sp.]|uniref:hypothetical protein n=1 Tax=Nocardioides sp. TaxID=35761 RepID=UPI0031FE9E49|nr:hypothetical protein [Nocardioides sp.]